MEFELSPCDRLVARCLLFWGKMGLQLVSHFKPCFVIRKEKSFSTSKEGRHSGTTPKGQAKFAKKKREPYKIAPAYFRSFRAENRMTTQKLSFPSRVCLSFSLGKIPFRKNREEMKPGWITA